jgi:putative membrane protein
MQHVYFIFGVVLGVVVAIFAVQNVAPVEVRFFLWHVEGPLAAVVLTAVGTGLVVALLLGLPDTILSRLRMRRLEHHVREANPEEQPHSF